MRDHETVIVNQLKEKSHELYKEKRLEEEEVFRSASVLDKIHAYLTMLAIVLIVLSPIYTVVSLIRFYILK